jgi:hypothetical protein
MCTLWIGSLLSEKLGTTDLGVRKFNTSIDLKREGNNNQWENTTRPKDSIVFFLTQRKRTFTMNHSLRYVAGFPLVFGKLRTREHTSYEAVCLPLPLTQNQHIYNIINRY